MPRREQHGWWLRKHLRPPDFRKVRPPSTWQVPSSCCRLADVVVPESFARSLCIFVHDMLVCAQCFWESSCGWGWTPRATIQTKDDKATILAADQSYDAYRALDLEVGPRPAEVPGGGIVG